MHINLICTKVSTLLQSFIEGTLSESEKMFVQEHLKMCTKCRYKYENLKKLFSPITDNVLSKQDNSPIPNTSYNNDIDYYLQSLSAYCDNEMSFEDSVKFKKYLIKNPKARDELKKIYKLRELFKKSKNILGKKLNHDFSKSIIKKLYLKDYKFLNFQLQKIATATFWTIILFAVLSGSFYLYFKQIPGTLNFGKLQKVFHGENHILR